MRWTESVVVDRPLAEVRRAIADEHELMRWSAWPEATGFTCAVEGDGRTIGSAIVFTDRKGVRQGSQTLTGLEPARVEYRLRNRGPGGREMTPRVDFRLDDLGGTRTRVHLDFEAHAPLPAGLRHLAEAVLGRRVRALHVEDLRRLKRHVESPAA